MNFLKVMPQNLKFNALITTDPLIVENTQGGMKSFKGVGQVILPTSQIGGTAALPTRTEF